MVDLINPTPARPVEGRQFSVTASGGSPPYTFIWGVDEGDTHTVTQDDPTLVINSVPEGSNLEVGVEDGTGSGTSETYPITSQSGVGSGS